MLQNPPQFVLETQSEINGKKMEASLYFRQSEETGRYYFNFYQARMNEDGLKNSEHAQVFYVNKGHGVTMKEAFNLLEGRAVHKELTNQEGEKYKAWLQLNFNEKQENGNYKIQQYYEGYRYDLENELKKYPIRELEDSVARERLIKSLEKGNLHTVTFEREGKEQKLLIEAAPKFKSVNVYDQDMKKQWAPSLEKEQEKSRKNEQKQEQKNDRQIKREEDLPEEKKTRKRSQSRESLR